MYDAMNRITRRMEEYPPERPGQRYIRTGTLYSNWCVTRLDNGYRVSNKTKYTQWVVGDAYGKKQAWMHKNRWPVFREVVQREIEDKLPVEIRNEIRLAGKRAGVKIS